MMLANEMISKTVFIYILSEMYELYQDFSLSGFHKMPLIAH